jgi:hypothetical protein
MATANVTALVLVVARSGHTHHGLGDSEDEQLEAL